MGFPQWDISMGKYGKIIKTLGRCDVAHVAEDYKRGYSILWQFRWETRGHMDRRAML